jgi:hypothetical protein
MTELAEKGEHIVYENVDTAPFVYFDLSPRLHIDRAVTGWLPALHVGARAAVMPAVSTKSRQVIYGGRIKGAENTR